MDFDKGIGQIAPQDRWPIFRSAFIVLPLVAIAARVERLSATGSARVP